MSDKASRRGDAQEPALQTLLRVIASRDRSRALRLLAESPLLARQAIEVGATREAASPYYLEEIAHYAYAGDTPLHMAAAAYQSGIAEELVSRGANVSAGTGAAPSRSTTRPMGFRDRMRGIPMLNMPSLNS